MEHTKIPEPELELFNRLKDIRVVFDIGAREDIDYLLLKPKITLHAFEPNPKFFEELKIKIGDNKKAHLNNFGLGHIEATIPYQTSVQAFEGGGSAGKGGDMELPVKLLDDYIKQKKIKRIDFMKLDTEGYELKILSSSPKAIKLAKYIQYEHWDNQGFINEFLKDFDIEDIGYRNVFCMSRSLLSQEARDELRAFIRERKFSELA